MRVAVIGHVEHIALVRVQEIEDSRQQVLGDAEAVVLDADDDLAALTRARRPRTATIDVEERQMMHTEANRLSEVLLDRRVQLFGGDPRFVTNVEAARDADGLRVRARSTVLDEDMARLTARSEPVAW